MSREGGRRRCWRLPPSPHSRSPAATHPLRCSTWAGAAKKCAPTLNSTMPTTWANRWAMEVRAWAWSQMGHFAGDVRRSASGPASCMGLLAVGAQLKAEALACWPAGFSKVKLVTSRETGKQYACKASDAWQGMHGKGCMAQGTGPLPGCCVCPLGLLPLSWPSLLNASRC